MIHCYFGCGNEVDPNSHGVWRRVVAWEHKSPKMSSRRGGSDISLREPTGEYACESCVARIRHGLDPKQESLL